MKAPISLASIVPVPLALLQVLPRCLAYFLLAVTVTLTGLPVTALGTLFVVDVARSTVGAYTNSGATINASLITGLNRPASVAVSGGFLYITSVNGTIGKYTTSGVTVNASLVTGLSLPLMSRYPEGTCLWPISEMAASVSTPRRAQR